MERQQVIRAAERFAKSALENDPTGHDWWHIDRVVRMAERLARKAFKSPLDIGNNLQL